MTRRLAEEGKVEGVHFCTLNLEKSVRRVLEGLSWVEAEAAKSNGFNSFATTGKASNAVIEVSPLSSLRLSKTPQLKSAFYPQDSYASAPPALTVTPATATRIASDSHSNTHIHATPASYLAPAGKLEPSSAASYSWDEYPNGRFTDTRSPAYGELDGYGAGLKILVGISFLLLSALLSVLLLSY